MQEEDCIRVRYHRPDGYARPVAPFNSTVSPAKLFWKVEGGHARVHQRGEKAPSPHDARSRPPVV
jgi:hypothetical protein